MCVRVHTLPTWGSLGFLHPSLCVGVRTSRRIPVLLLSPSQGSEQTWSSDSFDKERGVGGRGWEEAGVGVGREGKNRDGWIQ